MPRRRARPASSATTAQCAHQAATGAARNCKRNPAQDRLLEPGPRRPAVELRVGHQHPGVLDNPALGNCTKVKHAFRRDDLSGTTDAFQALVGLIALPPQTQLRSTAGAAFAPEIADFASTASPFCNGGTAVGTRASPTGPTSTRTAAPAPRARLRIVSASRTSARRGPLRPTPTRLATSPADRPRC